MFHRIIQTTPMLHRVALKDDKKNKPAIEIQTTPLLLRVVLKCDSENDPAMKKQATPMLRRFFSRATIQPVDHLQCDH